MTKLVNEQLAYSKFHNALDAHMRIHFRVQEEKYEGKVDSDGEGVLQFKDTQLTLHNLTSDNTVIFSSSDKALNYEYLMLRSIVGKAAHHFGDGVELLHGAAKFSMRTFLDSFDYKDDKGQTISGLVDTSGGLEVNREALQILREDRAEVKDIIKKILREYTSECNIIKNTAVEDINEICTNFAVEQIQQYTCFETFTSVSNPELNLGCTLTSEL